MNFRKSFYAILAGAFVLAGNFGCASTGSKAASQSVQNDTNKVSSYVNTATVDFPADEEHVKLLGRSIFINDNLIMAYSSTGAEFNISAKRLDVTITGDSAANMDVDNGSAARIVVFVNEERLLDEMILKPVQSYTVFDGTEVVEGQVRILKVSEVANSLAGIAKITTDKDGFISPTEPRKLKIEFIGDSITCGYGVDDLVSSNHFATATEDNSKSYAYKTAQLLDADYSMVSISGWGIISGYSWDGKKHADAQLPAKYDRMGFAWGRNVEGVDPAAVKWDFNVFVPDVVVINLGTNDHSYTKGNKDRIAEFTDAYVEFLKDVRTKNPGAYIICALGTMGQDLFPAIEVAVKEYTVQTGDENLCSLRLPQQLMSDGIAADWHPSEKTHGKAAKILADKINEIIK